MLKSGPKISDPTKRHDTQLNFFEAMKVIFFSKSSKFYVHFENSMKLAENVDGFDDSIV